MPQKPKPVDPLFAAAEEALRLSVSQQLDDARLSKGLSIERTATAAHMSKRAVLETLKTSRDSRLSSLLRISRATGTRMRIVFDPL